MPPSPVTSVSQAADAEGSTIGSGSRAIPSGSDDGPSAPGESGTFSWEIAVPFWMCSASCQVRPVSEVYNRS
jgi:hypothetical protein